MARRQLLALLAVAGLWSAACSSPAIGHCNTNRDCNSSQSCIAGRCTNHCAGGAPSCTKIEDCRVGSQCLSGCCAEATPCDVSTPCSTGLTCQGGLCQPPTKCTTDANCDPTSDNPVCNDQQQCVQCLSNADCSTVQGTICSNGSCTVPAPVPCTTDANCTDLTRHKCNTTGNPKVCVGCVTNADCGAASPVCDPQTLTCGPTTCSRDADCSAPNGKCDNSVTGGHCVACLADADCPTIGGKPQACTAQHVCVTKAGCNVSADCHAPAAVCVTATHACVQCVADSDCTISGKSHCETASNICVPPAVTSCTKDTECTDPSNPRCDTAKSACVACLNDGDCPDPASQMCTAQSTCTTRPGCNGNPSACSGSTPKCNTGTGGCVACLVSGDCTGGLVCANNVCVPANAGCASDSECSTSPGTPHCSVTSGKGSCVQCTANTQCGSQQCDGTTHACVGCGADNDCAGTSGANHCDTGTHACVQCTSSTQCANGQVCTNDACVTAPPPACTDDASCTGGKHCNTAITPHACVQCTTSAQCGAGKVCTANVCVVSQPSIEGTACTSATDCATGLLCVNDGTATTCRTACDPYATPSCGAGKGCGWAGFDSNGVVIGACLPQPTGALSVGADCTGLADVCKVELQCTPDTFDKSILSANYHCRPLCDPNAGANSCPSSAKFCNAIPGGDDGQGTTFEVGLCTPTPKWGEACGHSDDCGDANQICVARPLPTDRSVFADVCRYPIGPSTPGSPCAFGSDCQSGFCLEGSQSCDGACTYISDCTKLNSGTTCIDYPAGSTKENPRANLVPECLAECLNDKGCAPAADGSRRACLIAPTHLQSRFATFCYFALGKGKPGVACTRDADCETSVCLTGGSGTDGYCMGPCQTASDCDSATTCNIDPFLGAIGVAGTLTPPGSTVSYPGRAPVCSGKACANDADCTGLSLDKTKPRVCAPALQTKYSSEQWAPTCTSDAQCHGGLPNGAPDFCDPVVHKCLGADFVLGCAPQVGAAAVGANCNNSAECQSGLCFPVDNSGRQVCWGGCKSNVDCASGTTCKAAPGAASFAIFKICY